MLVASNAISRAERPGAARLLKRLVQVGLDPAALDQAAALTLALDRNAERN